MKLDNRTEKRRLGDIGENIACDFLKKRGFEIVDRNYSRKWGEIDIIGRKSNLIHFIEVKSVSCVTFEAVSHGTPIVGQSSLRGRQDGEYRPEDNMHPWKLKRLSRAMQTYLLEKNLEGEWQLDLITVKIDERNRKARVEMIENVII